MKEIITNKSVVIKVTNTTTNTIQNYCGRFLPYIQTVACYYKSQGYKVFSNKDRMFIGSKQ